MPSLLGRWDLTHMVLTNGDQVAVPGTVSQPDSFDLQVDDQVWEFAASGNFTATAAPADWAVWSSAGTWSLEAGRLTLTYQRDGEDYNGNGTVDGDEWSDVPEPEVMHLAVASNGGDGLRLTYQDGSALSFGVAGFLLQPAG